MCAFLLAALWAENLSLRGAYTSGREMPEPAGMSLAQVAAGYHCQTAAGVCPIDPAPLGAPCQCGNYQGVVVP